MIILNIFIALFIIIPWRKEFSSLYENSKWVNGFILLIPLSVIKENQYLKTFLKNKLKIKSLIYL